MYIKLKTALIDLAKEHSLLESEINITAKILTPKEAIGETKRKDFPLLQGKEFLIQADFKNSLGQAFTDAPSNFEGKLKKILELKLTDNSARALFIATLNAVMRYVGAADKTIHCKKTRNLNYALRILSGQSLINTPLISTSELLDSSRP